jgi:Holliday junction resolvasome RuvABC ATP-dependent DNA helicase subunit
MPDTSPYHPAFNHIIGQKTAKSALSMSIASHECGAELSQPLILGEAGLGKTELAKSYGNAIAEKLGVQMVEIGSPRDVRNLTEFDPIFQQLVNDPKFVLYLDEVHELESGKVAHMKLITFLRKGLDRQNEGKVVQISDQYYIPDRKNKVIILSTNHPDKVDTAIRSRCMTINLMHYNKDEIRLITSSLLEKNGLVIDSDDTLERMASCGRGTARPIVNLMRDTLVPMAALFQTNVITNDMVMEALRQNEMFPGGFNLPETQMMVLLLDSPKNRNQILSRIPNLDGIFHKAAAYMQSYKVIDLQTNGMFRLTEKGKTYIAKCRELRFSI